MTDPFSNQAGSLTAPTRAPFAIAPQDAVALPLVPKAIYVGTGGAITLRGVDGGNDVTLRNVASG